MKCNDNHLFIPYVGKSKELDYVRKSAHEVIRVVQSSAIISMRFTATMEMGTMSAIELSIPDQF